MRGIYQNGGRINGTNFHGMRLTKMTENLFNKWKWVWRIRKEKRHLWNLSQIWRWLAGSSQHSWLPILRGPAPVIVPFQLEKYMIFLLCCQFVLLPSEPGGSLCCPGALAGPLRRRGFGWLLLLLQIQGVSRSYILQQLVEYLLWWTIKKKETKTKGKRRKRKK